MSDSFLALGPCSKIGNGSTAIGYNAGMVHVSGTGGMFLGHQAGSASVSGPMSIAIGANSVVGTTTGSCIAIGSGATVNHASAVASSIALGNTAVCTTPNTIVLGAPIGAGHYGTVVQEYGRGHQYFWNVSKYSASATLSAMAILGGWIAFENIGTSATLTLPSLTDILAVFPTIIEGSAGEMIISNFNKNGYTVSIDDGAPTNPRGTWWYNTNVIPNNTIQHVYWRYVETSGWQQISPFIEFFA